MIANARLRLRPVLAVGALAVALTAGSVSAPGDFAFGDERESRAAPAGGTSEQVSAVLGALWRHPVPAPVEQAEPVEPAEPAEPVREEAKRSRHKVAKRLPLGASGLRERRKERMLAPGVTLTVIRRGGHAGGPWVVRVLTIDPEVAEGQLGTTIGPSLASTAPTTELIRRADALAGVNGSFFSIGTATPGDPVGLTVAAGKVLSEPSGMGREVTLLVDSAQNTLRIGSFDWRGVVRYRDGRKAMRLDKVNSAPRVPRACRDGKAYARCAKRGQVALFTPEFGKRTPRGEGAEFVLARNGCAVKKLERRGVRLHRHQSSLQATGAVARKVRALLRKECIDTTQKLRDRNGRPVELASSVDALTGRFRLLRHGRIVAPNRSAPFFGRHPRTIVGTTWDDKILLITIDGRSSRSVGATLRQAAKVARALGLRDAMNLDGGGSTTMSVRGNLVNDLPGAERAVSDALVWRAAG